MNLVYQLTHLTIAALESTDGSEGCFLDRRPGPDPVTVSITFPPNKGLSSISFKRPAVSTDISFVAADLS